MAQTVRGIIEYKIHGEAPYMLVLPGTPGPVHATLGIENKYPGFGKIFVSRPGYCRTPLKSGKTAEEQADLCMALLDYLKISAIVVYGISGAGPVALNLALKYPERVKALLLSCAVTGDFEWFDHDPNKEFTESLRLERWMSHSPTVARMISFTSPKTLAVQSA